MGMRTEIAAENIIRVLVNKMKSILNEKNPLEVSVAIKKIGRFTLAELEGRWPEWAEEYRELFKE